MAFPRRILLAVDEPRDAVLAARVAVDLCGRGGSELHVLHVARAIPPHVYAEKRPEDYHDLYEQQVEDLLDEMAELVEDAGGAVAGTHLRVGSAADEILGFGEEVGAELLVLGRRALGPLGRLIEGSVCEGVIRSSAIPVLVARGDERAWPPRRLVIWDDSSGGAGRAGQMAADLGGLFGATGLLLRVPPEHGGFVEGRPGEDTPGRRTVSMEGPGSYRPSVRLVSGDPIEAILDAVREEARSLVAVGSRGPARGARSSNTPVGLLRSYGGPLLVCPDRSGGAGEEAKAVPPPRRGARVSGDGGGF